MNMLNNGAVLTSANNARYTVIRFIAAGGQGEVYEVESKGKRFALKWYFKHSATAYQKKLLKRLLAGGAPDPRFLWPLDLVEGQ